MPRTNKSNANDPEKEETANTSMQVTQTMQTEAVQTQTIQRSSPPNHIFVGKKPVMSYAMSALIQLTQAGSGPTSRSSSPASCLRRCGWEVVNRLGDTGAGTQVPIS